MSMTRKDFTIIAATIKNLVTAFKNNYPNFDESKFQHVIFSNKNYPKKMVLSSNNKNQKIMNGILSGCDPITGEMFENQSCWRHPQISSDLKTWLTDL